MILIEPTTIVLSLSKFKNMEHNLRTHISKGQCSGTGHYGICKSGLIQLGRQLPHYDCKDIIKSSCTTIEVLFLGTPSIMGWRNLEILLRYLGALYPSIERITTLDENLFKKVGEINGRYTETRKVP